MACTVTFGFALSSEMYKHRQVKNRLTHFIMLFDLLSKSSLFYKAYLKNWSDFIVICAFRTVNSDVSKKLNGTLFS